MVPGVPEGDVTAITLMSRKSYDITLSLYSQAPGPLAGNHGFPERRHSACGMIKGRVGRSGDPELFLLAPLPPLPSPPRPPSAPQGPGRGGHASGTLQPRPAPPRPLPSVQEARKEPLGAMDGAVMEGPLFLQSQRFGTKVACICVSVSGAGLARPFWTRGGCKDPERGTGPEAGPSAARATVKPRDVPWKSRAVPSLVRSWDDIIFGKVSLPGKSRTGSACADRSFLVGRVRPRTPAPFVLFQRWRKTWAVLYPASPHGVARLEFFDHKGSSSGGGRGGSRRLDCKMIRLAECVSVVPVSVESPPEPGAAAFRLDTAQRSHLLAADALSSAAWVQTLCRNAFPVRGWGWAALGAGLADSIGLLQRQGTFCNYPGPKGIIYKVPCAPFSAERRLGIGADREPT